MESGRTDEFCLPTRPMRRRRWSEEEDVKSEKDDSDAFEDAQEEPQERAKVDEVVTESPIVETNERGRSNLADESKVEVPEENGSSKEAPQGEVPEVYETSKEGPKD